jgi:pimeloyl-ACP methyl ester carboxylesterase
VSELLEFSRILCRDEHGIWYHKGLSPETPDYPSSVAWLLEILSELAANTSIAVGTSSGGYAALLYGHLLRVDSVHAFSPHTCLERGHAFETRGLKNADRAELYDRLEAYPLAAREFFDLAEVLKHHNGKTKFFVHYCSSSERDRIDCERLRGLPGVTVTPHPCKGHNVALHLAKRRLLMDLLKPENQENIEELLSRRIE